MGLYYLGNPWKRVTQYYLGHFGKEEDEEKSRKKRLMRRKKKDMNIEEIGMSEPTEVESKPDCHQILQKANESSFEFWWRGPYLNQLGVEINCTLWMGPGQTKPGNYRLFQQLHWIVMRWIMKVKGSFNPKFLTIYLCLLSRI